VLALVLGRIVTFDRIVIHLLFAANCHGGPDGENVELLWHCLHCSDVLVTGIPSSCMTLLTVMTGQHNEENPIPVGNDSALFSDLSNEDIQEIQDSLTAPS
jgi:hypothetical protein